MALTITRALAAAFAHDWYAAMDGHAPVEELLARTAGPAFTVHFPGRELDPDGFAAWYGEDIRTHFDGRHHIHAMEIDTDGETAAVLLHITWRARRWTPPDACSEDVVLRPDVTLKLERNAAGDGIVLRSYSVVDRED